ncbi:LLM class flavin-dependent oxidoreductase [Rhodococcus sp. LB1]|uniref:LLM class flavin-dependent oxidoreductase n=1 Tax=Rhodococcus sp. LB1 TaxID=1807499 RepID=UPI0009ECE783|nr:LLM class flavin-dependent oxidoreductase [Rhodococcus sp. LB1]
MTPNLLDHSVPRERSPILGSPNRLKLSIFALNSARGTSVSFAESLPRATWSESVRLVKAAEDAGLEAVLPVAKWRNVGPAPDLVTDRIFEAFTWSAAVAAITGSIQVFSTFHVPF